jgi:hypothetical protein
MGVLPCISQVTIPVKNIYNQSIININFELNEQDALPTFPDAEAFSCIERELGLPLDSIFSSISPSPIAAASLGQVYKAQLTYSGQTVAVKVQRPGIEEAIGLDFYLIRGLGFFINKYVDIITSDVVALIDEFARRVYQELNYVQVVSFIILTSTSTALHHNFRNACLWKL